MKTLGTHLTAWAITVAACLLLLSCAGGCSTTGGRPTSIDGIKIEAAEHRDAFIGDIHYVHSLIVNWNLNHPNDLITWEYPRRLSPSFVPGEKQLNGWWSFPLNGTWVGGWQFPSGKMLIAESDKGEYQAKNARAEIAHPFIIGNETQDYHYMRKLGLMP